MTQSNQRFPIDKALAAHQLATMKKAPLTQFTLSMFGGRGWSAYPLDNLLKGSHFLHRAFFSFTLLLFSTVGVPKAVATILNFDNFTAGTLVTTPISGVTFTLANNTPPSIFDGASSSPPNSLLNASSFDYSTPPADLTITFNTPVNGLSLDYIYENGDLTFKIYQGATLNTVTYPFDSNPLNVNTADFSLYNGITSLTISSSYYQDFFGIDNVAFTPVPEPAAGFILILGLAVIGAFGQRRNLACIGTGWPRGF
jgi:hypothetical protein